MVGFHCEFDERKRLYMKHLTSGEIDKCPLLFFAGLDISLLNSEKLGTRELLRSVDNFYIPSSVSNKVM